VTQKVWVFTIVRNEALLMPYFVRHYRTFCERVIVFDDHSDDGTPDLAYEGGAEVEVFPWSTGKFDDTIIVAFANRHYREAARGQADWIMWVDGDEFVYRDHLLDRLAVLKAAGVTLPIVRGYAMCAPQPPTGTGQLVEEVTTGVIDPVYDKRIVVDPALDIEWQVGKHAIMATDAVEDHDGEPPIKLLHYRWFGEAEHVARDRRNWDAMSDNNRNNNLGKECRPDFVGDHDLAWYRQAAAEAAPCV